MTDVTDAIAGPAKRLSRRRAEDRRGARLYRAWREFVLYVAAGLAIYAAIAAADAVSQASRGRAVALGVTCAAQSAVIDAGRAIITGGTGSERQAEQAVAAARTPAQRRAAEAALERARAFGRGLERLGYPSRAQREANAKAAAAAYGRTIASKIERESGVKGITRPDGTLDCDALKRASGAA